MKIKKSITNLKEANDEASSGVVIDSNDSAAKVLNKITDSADSAGVTNATQVAAEVVAAADKLNAEESVVDLADDTGLGVKNKITDALDDALDAALYFRRRGVKEVANVMICGLPGSGKTASVYDWSTHATANGKPVNITYVNMKNNDLDAFINGYPVRDDNDPDYITQAFSRSLNGLEQENSILFLDEYNRQTENQIRASVLTLINEHYISGKESGGRHYFKNFLFTIAVMNPSVRTDRGAAELNDAEKSRFLFYYKNIDSDPDSTVAYLTKQYDKLVNAELKKPNPDYTDIEEALKAKDLGIFIVKHPEFKYDDVKALPDLARLGSKMLNQRSLTAGIDAAHGDCARFKKWLVNASGFLTNKEEGMSDEPATVEMLLSILDDYQVPSRESLFKKAGINVEDTNKNNEQKDDVVDTPADTEPSDTTNNDDIEDDDFEDPSFFTNSSTASGQTLKSPGETETYINDKIKEWGF